MNFTFHGGPPPHIGWWNASISRSLFIWRWWDGRHWSEAVFTSSNAQAAARRANAKSKEAGRIYWSHLWPANARVPRINPDTGEVTGGSA